MARKIPMKALQIMAGKGVGGAETAFMDTVIALHKRGLQQHAVIRAGAPCEPFLRQAGIEVTVLPFRKFFDFTTTRTISHIIRTFKPDIVQSWMNRATQFCPKMNQVHVGWFGGYYKAKNYTQCDYLVGVTPDICAHQTNSGWPAAKVQVLRTFAPIDDSKPVNRGDLDTPGDVPLLLNLARLHPKKAIDVLLKAMIHIPKAYLWIAGDGPLKEELEQMSRDLGVSDRVRFLGWRNDRTALLKTCDICVFPSRYEPFGTVMAEAWGYKVPLVTAASAGPKAHVVNGENGMLVPIDDVDALAKAVNDVIEDKALRDKIVAGGYATFEQDFSEEKVTESYLEFYNRVLKAA
jgi:glycosyltransferase involved in cell wall biosynthesis